jgi:hypothetical protein
MDSLARLVLLALTQAQRVLQLGLVALGSLVRYYRCHLQQVRWRLLRRVLSFP